MATTSISQPSEATLLCPTCNGAMRWCQNRTSRAWFQGCKKWPTCNGTRDVNGVDTRVSPQSQSRIHRILKAAVMQSEDECLTFTEEQLRAADLYELHLDEIAEEKSYVVTIKKKVQP